MRKIIFWIIIIGALYYYRNRIPFIKNLFESKEVTKVTDVVRQKLSEQTVTDSMKSWVLKDGVRLPQDWRLEERTIGTQKVTVMVPPKPVDLNDYIALTLKKELIPLLPVSHTCKEAETTATCLVGNNYETLKIFSMITFVK